MAGAIALAGLSAARTGAGLVRLAVPDCCLETVAGFSPCAMLVGLPDDPTGRIAGLSEPLNDWLARSHCVALGPGLGRGEYLDEFLLQLLRRVTELHPTCPLVVGAGGLVALSRLPAWRQHVAGPAILTPHPGEWQRLSGVPASQPEQQAQSAMDYAARHVCVVLLKGHRTLITDGLRSVRNQTGTPAMATGGSGDVLTGVITALICQGLAPYQAAQLGAHVHGRAGELAARHLGAHVVLPTDLIAALPAALAEVIG